MATNTASSTSQPDIRFSRTVSLTRAVALGSSITVGLGIFFLLGPFLEQGGIQTASAYLVTLVFFLPIVLTYAERAEVVVSSGGIFGLVRAGGATWRTYASGWLLLGGHLALISLLGWGVALYINAGTERLLDITIPLRWLAPTVVIVVAINDLIGTRGTWRLRLTIVYSGILLLLLLVLRAWLQPTVAPPAPDPAATGPFNIFTLVALMAASLWSIQFVLDRRDMLRQPEYNLLPALGVPLLLSALIGAALTAAGLGTLAALADFTVPVVSLAAHVSFTGDALLEIVAIVSGCFIGLTALDRAMVTMLRLTGSMVRDGFIPERLLTIAPSLGTPIFALRLFAVISALTAAFVPKSLQIGFVALIFLAVTILLNAPDLLVSEEDRHAARRLKLPFHPLFPGLTVLLCAFLVFALPPLVLIMGLGWALIGALYYLGYARQRGLEARRRETVVGAGVTERRKTTYTVLVGTANPETAPNLIHAGVVLARARGGRVLVLRVLTFPDQVPPYLQRQQAQEALDELNQIIQDIPVNGIPVTAAVRLAQNPTDGILATVQEERADMIVLGWESEHHYHTFDLDPLLDPIVRMATCAVVVVRGRLPQTIHRILVPTAGSPNSIAAIQLAQKMVEPADGHVVAIHLVQEVFSPNTMDEINQRMQDILKTFDSHPPIEPCITATDDVREGIVQEAQHYDALLLGASRGGILDQAIFGGLPVEVAQESPRPTLLVKGYEGARRFWVRRAWETISSPFPKLTLSERNEIYQQMWGASHPGIDFFILIGLAGIIATAGLLLNSPAIIIGAMLVAPLMSPILAVAMSIVQGDLRLLRLSSSATMLGIMLAVGVSVAITIITPTHINTTEILSRTEPNLLDLLVALASGAAGGYAAARKEVAAALPGVAIAAALVPPLGVVGYGMGTGQIDIAGGSALLFTTNLIAIIVAAAIVNLLLGFRPTQARMRQVVQLKFFLSLLALLLISIPLTIFSASGVGQIISRNQIDTVLNRELDSDVSRVTDILVERQGNGFVVHATVYVLETEPFGTDRLGELEARLQDAVETPVTLRATVLRAAHLPERGDVVLPQPTPVR